MMGNRASGTWSSFSRTKINKVPRLESYNKHLQTPNPRTPKTGTKYNLACSCKTTNILN